MKDLFVRLYTQLVKMDGSPHSIALGFGIGVFLGILPGTGPVAALVLAFIFRVNKAAALLGSVLTNTWLSMVTFVLAARIGSMVLGLQWADVQAKAHGLLEHFSWRSFFDVSLGDVLRPLLAGYAVVGLVCGAISYLVALVILKNRR